MLFERRGPRIRLTSAGRALYRIAMPLVEIVDRLPATFNVRYRGVTKERLVIAASPATASYLLPDCMRRFRNENPDARITVKIGTGEERMRWLRTFEVDVALCAVDIPPVDVDFYPLCRSPLVLITPEDHPLAGRTSIEPHDLTNLPMIGHSHDEHIQRLMEQTMRLHGVAPLMTTSVDGWFFIKRFVEAGIGIAIVPNACLRTDDRLWRIPLDRFVPPRIYGIVARRDGLMSPVASRFVARVNRYDGLGASEV